MRGTDRWGRDLKSSVGEGVFCSALVALVRQVEVEGISDEVEDRVPVRAVVHEREKERESRATLKPWSLII